MLQWVWRMLGPERDWDVEWDDIEDVIRQRDVDVERRYEVRVMRRAFRLWSAYASLLRSWRQWRHLSEPRICMV